MVVSRARRQTSGARGMSSRTNLPRGGVSGVSRVSADLSVPEMTPNPFIFLPLQVLQGRMLTPLTPLTPPEGRVREKRLTCREREFVKRGVSSVSVSATQERRGETKRGGVSSADRGAGVQMSYEISCIIFLGCNSQLYI
jgi:hypothetical protein